MDKLVQSRPAMQRTLLVNAVVFFGLLFATVVAANDHHWLVFPVFIAIGLVCIAAVGPRVYAFEQRPFQRVRLHRAIGVVDLDLDDVIVAKRGRHLVVQANGHKYPVIWGVGSQGLVNEWLRRAARP